MIRPIAAVLTAFTLSARKNTHDLRQKVVRVIGTPTEDVIGGLMHFSIRQLKSV
jgi:hypothetical protein